MLCKPPTRKMLDRQIRASAHSSRSFIPVQNVAVAPRVMLRTPRGGSLAG
jgi:hypothetical protein